MNAKTLDAPIVCEPPNNAAIRAAGISGRSAFSYYALGAILLITVLTYIKTAGFQFVYDDGGQIAGNPLIRSWRYLPGYFVTHVWSFNAGPPANYYRPVFLVWLLINHTLFGLNAAAWHLATLGVHLAVTVLVYRLALRLLADPVAAAIASLVFALHPIHIESVAWVSGVTDPLLAVWMVSSLLCYIRSRESDRAATGIAGAAAIGFYALALLSKETGIILPLLLIGYEWINRPAEQSPRTTFVRIARIELPYLAVTLAYIWVRTRVLGGFSHTLTPLGPATLVLTWPSVIWFYLKSLFWPVGLSVFYDFPYISAFSVRAVGIPLLLIVTIGVSLWLCSRRWFDRERRRVMGFSLLLLGVPLLPVMNLAIFTNDDALHDRYLYLPSIGFSILVAIAIRRLPAGRPLFGQPGTHVLAAMVLALLLGLGTTFQETHWASDLLLAFRGTVIAPRNVLAKNNLAADLSRRSLFPEAVGVLTQALKEDPNNWRALSNMGFATYQLGRPGEAEGYLARAIELQPDAPAAYFCLGRIRYDEGRRGEAAEFFRKTIQLRPQGDGFHDALGTVLEEQGDPAGALDQYRLERSYNPNRPGLAEKILNLEQQLSQPATPGGAE